MWIASNSGNKTLCILKPTGLCKFLSEIQGLAVNWGLDSIASYADFSLPMAINKIHAQDSYE